MGQNDQPIRVQFARANRYVDRTRQAQAREAARQALPVGTGGPVKPWHAAVRLPRCLAAPRRA